MERQPIPDQPRLHREVSTGYETLALENEEGAYELSVLVSGVYCAACIQKIEGSLTAEQDIKNARLNFSTRRLSLVWNGDAARANDFVDTIKNLGYDVQPYDPDIEQEDIKREERFLLLCLGVAGFAMGNVMLLSVGVWSTSAETMGMATRDFMHWIAAIIALPTILFSGRPFFRSALKALGAGRTNMDVPISLALCLASGMSLFETIHHGEHVYFDSAVMLTFFLLVGRYLDFRARKNARSSATDLLSSLSGFATVIEGQQTRKILIRDLKEGMIVQVAAGKKIPADGHVIKGSSDVDVSLITGETLPQNLTKGGEVFAGTLNLSAPVTVKVSKATKNSLVTDIAQLMEKAGQGQARYVRLAERAARLYTPVVHSCALLAFLGWWLVGGLLWQEALMIAVTVLIITCPCALGLAVPVVQTLASGRLMKQGILVKSGDALERLARIDTVLLDKTGTLTIGKPELEGTYDHDHLQIAASLAAHSAHPLSKALHYDGALLDISDVQEHPGKGLSAAYQGQKIQLGSRAWCGDQDARASDQSELWLRIGKNAPTVFYFTDHLRADAADTISALSKAGLKPIMLSGDRKVVADKMAKQAGIKEIYAEQTPVQKSDVLENFKGQGHNILMVGDGLNDAPVLAGADVSMAPGTAIDMAQNAADIVFMGDQLMPVYQAYKTARMAQKLIKQNFALAILYNIIAIPLALGGFVTPLVAAIAMSGSSLLVVTNSFRLRYMA